MANCLWMKTTRGRDTRGTGSALAPPLFEEGGRDPASHAHPTRIELRMRLLAPPIAFPHTRASIMAKRQASLMSTFTYLRSSMSERRLNNCLLLHVHKDVTDSLD